MFRRVILESWHDFVPYLCFALIGGSFIVILVRAILMKPAEAGRLSAMPLRDDDELREARESSTPSDTTRR